MHNSCDTAAPRDPDPLARLQQDQRLQKRPRLKCWQKGFGGIYTAYRIYYIA